MKLKNYQEDVVLRAIEIALEDSPELLEDGVFVNDVAAYVLNRIPPRYVMSERGFLRMALEHADETNQDKSLANVIELMILVNQGLDLVRSRRSDSPPPRPAVRGAEGLDSVSDDPRVEYVHNYPQIIGRVVDGTTGSPVVGAKVSMHLDGDLVPPAAPGWQNPYRTTDKTRGHFSFWPRSARSERSSISGELLFFVEHPDYEPFTAVEKVTTTGDFDPHEVIRGDKILALTPFHLSPRS
jgi:competence protein ComFB